MNRRTKIILLTAIILLTIVLIILFLIRARIGRQDAPNATTVDTTLPAPLPEVQSPTVIEPPPTGPQEQNPSVITANFIERYGSYSNQGNYQNLRDLYPQMTAALQTRTDEFIAANPLSAGAYQGTTTKVLRSEITAKTETEIQISVSTQRIESTETDPKSRIFYQNAKLTLKKDGLLWLVDQFEWGSEGEIAE